VTGGDQAKGDSRGVTGAVMGSDFPLVTMQYVYTVEHQGQKNCLGVRSYQVGASRVWWEYFPLTSNMVKMPCLGLN